MKILAIGNSYTEDSFTHLLKVLESQGKKDYHICFLYIGGSQIDLHYKNILEDNNTYDLFDGKNGEYEKINNYSIKDAMKLDDFDIITIQQQSARSGQKDTFKNLDNLLDQIDKLKKEDSKVLFIRTWAYPAFSTFEEFDWYDRDCQKMNEAIEKVIDTIIRPNKRIEGIVPIGNVIYKAKEYFMDEDLYRDDLHLSYDEGRYIAACTIARFFMKLDYAKLNLFPQIKKEVLETIIETAYTK